LMKTVILIKMIKISFRILRGLVPTVIKGSWIR